MIARTRAIRAAIIIGVLACGASPVLAQTYSIPRQVIASGGGKTTGGTFTVTGTIGGIAAGAGGTGGAYVATGGFWSMPLTQAQAFSDEPLIAGTSLVRGLHILELRGRINALRARFGLPAAIWTDAVLGGVRIKAQHIAELRTALQAAYSQAGLAFPAVDEPVLVAGSTPVRALHIAQLRIRVKNLDEK